MSQYPWLLLAVYVVTVGVVQLLALWAATSQLPWLLRALVVWVPIALLATIRANEPAIMLMMSAALTIAICLAIDWYSTRSALPVAKRPTLWRFRLADLMVLILFLGTWLGLNAPWATIPVRYQLLLPLFVALFAMPLAILTVCSYRAVVGPWRAAMTIATLTVIWICALLLRARNVPLYLGDGSSSLDYGSGVETLWIVVEGAMPLILVFCLAIPLIALRVVRNLNQPARRRVVLLATIVAVAIAIPTVVLIWDDLWRVSQETVMFRITEVGILAIPLEALAGLIALVTWLCSLGWGQAAGWKPRLARAAVFSLALVAGLPGV